ncbi:MAG: hypothetical protein AAFR84_00975 [Pseudomonadota bacterium]
MAKVEVDDRSYSVDLPIAGLREVLEATPTLRTAFSSLGSQDPDYGVALKIAEIGLRYGGSGVSVEEFYTRHGWAHLALVATETLLAGLDPAGNRAAAGREADQTAESSE